MSIMIKNVCTKVQPLFEYLLCFILILEGNSIYVAMIGGDNPHYFEVASVTLIIILIILQLLAHKRKSINNLSGISLFINGLVIYLAYFMYKNVINTPYSEKFLVSFLLFLPLMLFLLRLYAMEHKEYEFILKISDIIVVLAVISLFFWIFAISCGLILRTGKVQIGWGWNHYVDNFYNVFFVNPAQYGVYFGKKIFRNTGIFPESPMYNIFLVIALYGELFFRQKTSKIRIAILSLTILTTFGTTGYLLMIMGFFLKYIDGRIAQKKFRKQLIISGIIAGVIIAILLIHKMTAGAGSSSVRVDDYMAGIKAWLTAPFFGTGFNDRTAIVSFMSAFRNDNLGYSNSVFAVLAEGGIVLMLVYALPLLSFLIQYFRGKSKKYIYFGLAMFVLFMTTTFEYQLIMMLILAYGYMVLDKYLLHCPLNNTIQKIHADRYKIRKNIKWIKFSGLVIILFVQMMSWMKLLVLWNSTKITLGSVLELIIVIGLSALIMKLSVAEQNKKIIGSEIVIGILFIVYALYNHIWNFIRTTLQMAWMYTQFEPRRFWNVVIVLGIGLALCLLLFRKCKYLSCRILVTGIVFVGVFVGSVLFNARINEYMPNAIKENKLLNALKASEVDVDSVYVDDVPFILQQLQSGYQVKGGIPIKTKLENVLVFGTEEKEIPELIDQGYKCGLFSGTTYIYVKGDTLVGAVEEQGIELKAYYGKKTKVNLRDMAYMNDLKYSKKGLVVEGKEKVIHNGPSFYILKGKASVTYQLELISNKENKAKLGTVQVNSLDYTGKTNKVKKDIKLSDFDEHGIGSVTITSKFTETSDMDFLLRAGEDVRLRVTSIVYQKVE